MPLKIKWNDDRVTGTLTAVLLIGRDRLRRGRSEDLVAAALADYRADPEGFKQNRKVWPGVRESAPLSQPGHEAYYGQLVAEGDRLLVRWTRNKRQFNSLLELDNAFIASLPRLG